MDKSFKIVFTALMFWLMFSAAIPRAYADTPPHLSTQFKWEPPHTTTFWYQTTTLAEIEEAFNAARAFETQDLAGNPAVSYLPLPPLDIQSHFTLDQWLEMSHSERALWLINEERTARDLLPLEGIDPNLNEVAQSYAQFMLDNDLRGHFADEDPIKRITRNENIGATCLEFITKVEALSYFHVYGTPFIKFPVETSIYWWIYNSSSWGHRDSMLYNGNIAGVVDGPTMTDNTGRLGAEGVIGIGVVEGYDWIDYSGGNQLIVYKFYDPSIDCPNIPALPVSENSLQIGDFIKGQQKIELYNKGKTAIGLGAYSLEVTEMDEEKSADAAPITYTLNFSPTALHSNATYTICESTESCDRPMDSKIAVLPGDFGTVTLRLSGVEVDSKTYINSIIEPPTAVTMSKTVSVNEDGLTISVLLLSALTTLAWIRHTKQ